jgi:type II secretory pathway pseudopilin PulG
LVELAVVIVIIGVLAAFGVPRFLVSVERSKAAEAFAFLSAVRDAQERYQAQNGTYASNLNNLDINQPNPTYFTVGPCTATDNSWTCTLTRQGSTAGYGAYLVTFTTSADGTQAGFDAANSTIKPEINPMGSAGGTGGT